MKIKTIIGLCFLISLYSCKNAENDNSKNNVDIDNQIVSDDSIIIQNFKYRGTDYIDSFGNNNKLRYIPVSITNTTNLFVDITIEFEKEYQYPTRNVDEKFKVIPLPTEWGVDGKGITDKMRKELIAYIDQPKMNLSLKPKESIRIAIGTLYPLPAQNGGIDAKTLFVQNDNTLIKDCKWLLENSQQINQKKSLALKLDFQGCIIIPCGEFHFRE